MDKWGPQLDSARRIGLESTPHESSDCSVDVSTGGEVYWAKIRKSEMWENVFNGGATPSGRVDKQRLQLDSARQTCLGNTSHEPSDHRCGGEVCWGGILKIGKVAGCFSQWSRNQQPWDQMEDTAGLGIVLPTLFE